MKSAVQKVIVFEISMRVILKTMIFGKPNHVTYAFFFRTWKNKNKKKTFLSHNSDSWSIFPGKSVGYWASVCWRQVREALTHCVSHEGDSDGLLLLKKINVYGSNRIRSLRKCRRRVIIYRSRDDLTCSINAQTMHTSTLDHSHCIRRFMVHLLHIESFF